MTGHRDVEPYPWMSDEVIYQRGSIDSDPETDSWIALAELDEELEIVGHRNTHRLTLYSPVHGLTSHLVNAGDLEALMKLAIAGLHREGRDNWDYYFRCVLEEGAG